MSDDVERGHRIAESGKHTPTPPEAEPGHPVEADAADRPVFPAPTAPLDVARQLYRDGYRDDDGLPTMIAWRGSRMRWHGPHWAELDNAELRSDVYDKLGGADYLAPIKVKGEVVGEEPTPWNPNKHRVADVLEAMAAIGHVSSAIDPPSWLHSAVPAETPAAQMISCTNGLLDRATRNIHPHTPTLFNVVSVPFAYDPGAPKPEAWLKFLRSVWPNDSDSIALLQEFVGYVLSGRTDMQKLLMLIGPTRSGKGTIARILTLLVGAGHTAGPTLASLGTNFGLSPLLGKVLAIISDARLGEAPVHTVVERLLSITGEDMLTVDRKFRDPWSGKLSSRFVILSNELPRFRDASGAIANRMLILQMTKSFLGREDRTLDARLRAELPGILNWALDGLDRLNENGHFTVPESSEDATNLMADLASPISAFVRDICIRGPRESVPVDDLYSAWQRWAWDQGHHAGAKSTFGRNLRAVVPEAKTSRPRVWGVQVHCYVGIRLRSEADNALVPDSPDSDGESAGQSSAAESGGPDSPPYSQSGAQTESGSPDSNDAIKTQVSGAESGESGTSALRTQCENRNGAADYGRFTADPPCYHCDKPVTGKHRDEQGRYLHHECERQAEGKSIPGDPTETTPGMASERVQQALAKARASRTNGAQQQVVDGTTVGAS